MEYRFNETLKTIPPSASLAIGEKAKALKAAGVDGPNVQYIYSYETSINNFDIFRSFAETTMPLEAEAVRKSLPLQKVGGGTVLASQLLSPALQITELMKLGADFIIAPVDRIPALSFIKKVHPDHTAVIIGLKQFLRLKGVKATAPKQEPKNYIFFDDSDEEINQKFFGAFCTDEEKDNPIYEYVANLLLWKDGKFAFNGKEYTTIEEYAADFHDFVKKDLKETIARMFLDFVTPIRPKITVQIPKCPTAF